MAEAADRGAAVRVFCRVRPPLPRVRKGAASKRAASAPPRRRKEPPEPDLFSVVAVDDDGRTVRLNSQDDAFAEELNDSERVFPFFGAFGPDAKQEEVFEKAAQHILPGLFRGENGAILAYGQTRSGKTYTMLGEETGDAARGYALHSGDSARGVIPRVCESICARAEAIRAAQGTVVIEASFLEIYVEKVLDLLDPNRLSVPIERLYRRSGLRLLEDDYHCLHVPGAERRRVNSPADILAVLREGAAARATAATNSNTYSSRSHAVLILSFGVYSKAESRSYHSQLYLCDLAGSERLGKTEAQGLRLQEAKRINTSLLALGNVVQALAKPKTPGRAVFVPYRTSKLTRILRNALGGNGRTSIICTVSPTNDAHGESLSTLAFGARCQLIHNSVQANVFMRSSKELEVLLSRAESEIGELKQQLARVQAQRELCICFAGCPAEAWQAVVLPKALPLSGGPPAADSLCDGTSAAAAAATSATACTAPVEEAAHSLCSSDGESDGDSQDEDEGSFQPLGLQEQEQEQEQEDGVDEEDEGGEVGGDEDSQGQPAMRGGGKGPWKGRPQTAPAGAAGEAQTSTGGVVRRHRRRKLPSIPPDACANASNMVPAAPIAAPNLAPLELELFCCPLSQRIMIDPVVCEDGVTYERSAIERYFEQHGFFSPATGGRLESARLVANRVMEHMIARAFRAEELLVSRRRRAGKWLSSEGGNILPVEILQEIFQHLDGRTLARCSMVCQLWYDSACDDRLWRVCLSREYSIDRKTSGSYRKTYIIRRRQEHALRQQRKIQAMTTRFGHAGLVLRPNLAK